MMIGTLGSVGSLVAAPLYRWNDDRNPWFIDGMMTGTLDSVGSLVAATLYRQNDDRNPRVAATNEPTRPRVPIIIPSIEGCCN
jgi:hypothetical protein